MNNILIGTLAHGGLLHVNYLNTILSLTLQREFTFSVMSLSDEPLIPRGRNAILTYFYNTPENSHLLFLDSDIFIDASNIVRMFRWEKDVIGAPVALKGFNEKGEKIYNVGNVIQEELPSLFEVDKVGTGVLLLSRKAVTDLILDAETNGRFYNGNKNSRVVNYGNNVLNPERMYDVFRTDIENETYLSEDSFVCQKLRHLGHKIYADNMIKTIHAGMVEF